MPIIMYAAENWTWTKQTRLLKSTEGKTKGDGIRYKTKLEFKDKHF
jgi:hypothetical protein